jgi:hypothetical protein
MPEMQGQEIGADPLGLPGKDLKKKLTIPFRGGEAKVFPLPLRLSSPI